MKLLRYAIPLALSACSATSVTPEARTPSSVTDNPAVLPLSPNLADWVSKDVCVDSSNRVLRFDPYFTCPSGTSRRKIQLGDPLPYHNFDQAQTQAGDNFPVLDRSYQPLYISTFDWAPFGQFNLFDGSDGYDYYTFKNGFYSVSGTRDGGGYGQVFYGANCVEGAGWLVLPQNNFLAGGQTSVPIGGSYWEQTQASYPGVCPRGYGNPVTSWELKRNYAFGGIDGNAVKTMDAVASYHGFDPKNPKANMEVTYYTRQYGRTKWEAWINVANNPTKSGNCVSPDRIQYRGQTFVVADCRDWSRVALASDAAIPQWPIAAANLLQHSHFDAAGGYGSRPGFGFWNRGGNSAEGHQINWSLFPDANHPAATLDKRNGTGVRYLATNCGGTCTGPNVQQIYQELPISAFRDNQSYLFGVNARTEGGSGTIKVVVQEIAGDGGPVLWSDEVDGNVGAYNGSSNDSNSRASVYLSVAFVRKLTKIPVLPHATKVRFIITPMTGNTFEVLDAWLNPFPAVNASFAPGF